MIMLIKMSLSVPSEAGAAVTRLMEEATMVWGNGANPAPSSRWTQLWKVMSNPAKWLILPVSTGYHLPGTL